jgi:hypothetical protein
VAMKLNLKERLEENVAIYFIVAMIVSFGSGFGAYEIILKLSKLETIQQDSYVLKKDFSNYNIEWDQTKRLYVLRSTDNAVLKATIDDDISQLAKTGSNIRSLTYHQFKLLRSQALDKLKKKKVPVYVEDILKNTKSELNIASESKSMSSLLISLNNQIMSKYFSEREIILNAINTKERISLERHKLMEAQWTPPSYTNIANLNLKERQIESINIYIEISTIRTRDIIEMEWTPILIAKLAKNKRFLQALREGKNINERLDIFNNVFTNVFDHVNNKYELLNETVTDQHHELINFIDAAFIDLISGKSDAQAFNSSIDNLRLEKVKEMNLLFQKFRVESLQAS